MSTLYLTRDEVEPTCEHDALEYGQEGWYCVECQNIARVKGSGEYALEGAYSEEGSHASSLDPSPCLASEVNKPLPSPPTPCVEVTERAIPDEPAHHWRIEPGVPVAYVPGARAEDMEPESPSRTYTIREPRHINGMVYPEDREPVTPPPTPGAPLRPEDRLAMSAEVAYALRSGLHCAVDLVESADEPAQQLAALDRLVKLASALDRASTNSHVQGEDTAATVSGVSLSS